MMKAIFKSQNGRALWLYVVASFFAILAVVILGTYTFRTSVAQKTGEWFFKSKNISAQFKVEKLDWNEVLITHVNLENGILIPKIHILRSLGSQQVGDISSIEINITSMDILTTQKLLAILATKTDETSTPLPTFADISSYCDMLKPTNVAIGIENIVHENISIPLNFKILHALHANTATVSFAGDAINLNKEGTFKVHADRYSGELTLSCSNNAISLTSKELIISLKELKLNTPLLKANNTFLLSPGMNLLLTPDNVLSAKLPLKTSIKAQFNEQKIDFKLPHFLISGSASLDGTNTTNLQMQLDNFSSLAPKATEIKKIKLTVSKISPSLETALGNIEIKNFTFKDEKQVPLVQNVHTTINFEKSKDLLKAQVAITDSSKNLAFKNIKISSQNNKTTVLLDKNQSKIQLNANIPDLIPLAKEYIKGASGDILLSGAIQLYDGIPKGQLRLWTKGIDLSTGFGDINGLSFDHDVLSLETFASSQNRILKIKNAIVGKPIDNVELEYHVHNQDFISGRKLHIEHEGALIDAENFEIYPLKKELKNFKSTIKKLKLDHVLAMAVGPFITADGTLSGNLALELQDKIPTVKGNLTSDQESWIHYRKEGDQQQKAIRLSDNPMSILNNYLYNFHYKKLDLEIATNREYQMNVLLAAYGHNPDYLEGKPLKLKINLEQNVLGAIQSMMLSYDLPSKLKEKLEKAGD